MDDTQHKGSSNCHSDTPMDFRSTNTGSESESRSQTPVPIASSAAEAEVSTPKSIPSRHSLPMRKSNSSGSRSVDYQQNSSRSPSRPPSTYMNYLSELEHSPELSRRLSVSTSRRNSCLSTSSLCRSSASDEGDTTTPTVQSPIKSLGRASVLLPFVSIRDFAFSSQDLRHVGQGPTATELANQSLQLTTLSEGVFEDSSGDDASLSSSGPSHFSWGFLPPHSVDATSPDPFSTTFSGRAVQDFSDEDPNDEEHLLEQGYAIGADIPAEGLLYRAAYSFAPEASQEMALNEGEVVRVHERVCEGWVVACRLKHMPTADKEAEAWTDAEETGLVPESYLIQVDGYRDNATEGERPNSFLSTGETPQHVKI